MEKNSEKRKLENDIMEHGKYESKIKSCLQKGKLEKQMQDW